jgi:hypothetical protein
MKLFRKKVLEVQQNFVIKNRVAILTGLVGLTIKYFLEFLSNVLNKNDLRL